MVHHHHPDPFNIQYLKKSSVLQMLTISFLPLTFFWDDLADHISLFSFTAPPKGAIYYITSKLTEPDSSRVITASIFLNYGDNPLQNFFGLLKNMNSWFPPQFLYQISQIMPRDGASNTVF